MQKIIFFFALLFSYISVYSQNIDRPGVLEPIPFVNISPNGFRSTNIEINGFDNIFLGIDLGEPYIATNPNDPLNSICSFNRNGLYYTLDGFNWVRNIPSFTGYSILGDPVMTYDGSGNCLYSLLYQNGFIYGVAVMKTTDKGISWIGPYNVFSTTIGLVDKEWIAADQTDGPYRNNIYLGWRQYGATGMRFVRSTNGGVIWSSPLSFTGIQDAFISIGPNGSIQGGSVYLSATYNNTILVTRSTDGGDTFSPQVLASNMNPPGVLCAGRRTLKDCIRMNYIPGMAVDNSYMSTRGNVYLAYCSNPSGPDNCDIYLIRSTDYGQTWSPGIKVNDDNTTTDQWLPTISVDKFTGRIYVTWYDSRVDPENNILTRIYGAVSTNGGVSFLPNDNISDVSFNPNLMAIGLAGGEKYIGDYIGNSAINNTAYHVWMDGRNNDLGSYTGFYPDFAMTVNPIQRSVSNEDSTFYSIVIPSVRGPFNERVKFTAVIDTMPLSGTIDISFENGTDSISAFPDSVKMKIKTSGNVTKGIYAIAITGTGIISGAPVHKRNVELYVDIPIGISSTGIQIPNEFQLHQNYPNPFNPATRIKFDLLKAGHVEITIYNLLGQTVYSMQKTYLNAGSHSVEWDAKNQFDIELSSGVYFLKLSASGLSQTIKLIYLK